MDDDGWRALLEEQGPFAWGLARQALRQAGMDPSLAEDLLQEVWMRLRSSEPDPARGIRPYLAASVLNAVRTLKKTGARRAVRERDHAPRPPCPEAPEEPLIRAEASAGLERALLALEPSDRLLLRWIYWDAMSYQEASALAGIPANSVGPSLSRARERLRQALGGESEIPARRDASAS